MTALAQFFRILSPKSLALTGPDPCRWWQETLEGSLLIKPVRLASQKVREALEGKAARLGTFMQWISYGLTVFMIAALGMQQFAKSKTGLALICLVALGFWTAGWLVGGREHRRSNLLDLLVLAFLGVHVISACSSHYFIASLKGLSKVIVYIGGYFLFTFICAQSERRRLDLVIAMLLGATCVSLYGLYQYKVGVAPLATWEDPSIRNAGTRIYSTLGNPNLLAGFLVPCAPMLAALAAGCLAGRRRLLFLLSMAALVLIVLATLLTGSRGGYLGLGAGMAMVCLALFVWLLKIKRKARPLIIVAALSLATAGIVGASQVPSVRDRVESMFAGRDHSSNSYRMNVWGSSLTMLRDNWWIGCGVGNEAFRLAYGLYMVSGYDALGTYSVPLEVAVECGIVGLALFAGVVLVALSRAHLAFWRGPPDRNNLDKWLALGAAGAIVGLMMHGVVDTVFYRPQIHFIFWLLIAMLSVYGFENENSEYARHRSDQNI